MTLTRTANRKQVWCCLLGTTLAIFLLAISLLTSSPALAGNRALPEGQLPDDVRLKPLKTLNGYFPFQVPATADAWKARSKIVRRQVLVSQGLWPMPSSTPLNPVIHGRVELDDYTVERAYFESMPGFFVTGSLYRPKGKSGKHPAVLCPHGHWANGRFFEHNQDAMQKEIASGGEKLLDGGRNPLQARCVHLARMGCVVFHYDMLGYADSQQISFEVAHRFAKQRESMNSTENWGLFSPQAESRFQTIMGLQTYNSIRALDFVTSLPDVDPSRIGVTGASGGGTQTFILTAVDPRPTAAFPAVMVSTAMQGGCTCENVPLLRVGTGNVEIAALFAPKPLGLTAADDWTKEMTTKGFPELQSLYRQLGAPDNVFLLSRTEFGHNYNYVSRLGMYKWFNEHLKLGITEPIDEREYKRLTAADMTVWDNDHPKPSGGEDFERKLLRWWSDDSDRQIAQLNPTTSAKLDKFREIVGGGFAAVIRRGTPESTATEYRQTVKDDLGTYLRISGLVRNKQHNEELPVMFLHPKDWNGRVVLRLADEGKKSLFTDSGEPRPEIKRLIEAGVSVASVDLIYQGEFLVDGKPLDRTRKITGNDREAAAYSFGYNDTVFAQRVHDVLTMVGFIKNHEDQPKEIDVLATGGAGAVAAVARSQVGYDIHCAAIETAGFRFAGLKDFHHSNFLPGGAKYGDIPAVLALAAPGRTWVAGEKAESLGVALAAYATTGAQGQLTTYSGNDAASAGVDWLLQQDR